MRKGHDCHGLGALATRTPFAGTMRRRRHQRELWSRRLPETWPAGYDGRA